MISMGQAARQLGVSKGTLSKAIASGKLSAARREDGSWAIDPAELHRYLEANGHRFRSAQGAQPETGSSEQPVTTDPDTAEIRLRAEIAEQLLTSLREALADMRRQRDDMERQRDKWETVATRLSLPPPSRPETPPATPETPRNGWRSWFKATG